MPKSATQSRPRIAASKARSRSRFSRVKAATQKLTRRDQERLADFLKAQSAKAGRARVLADLKEAREEIAKGNFITGSVEEIMRALNE